MPLIARMKGYIYNIDFGQIKKILNVTGKKLFSKNVRVGLKENKIGKK